MTLPVLGDQRFMNLKDEYVCVGGVLSQGVFPWYGELGLLRVGPAHTRILAAVDLSLQPGNEKRSGVRHLYKEKSVIRSTCLYFCFK